MNTMVETSQTSNAPVRQSRWRALALGAVLLALGIVIGASGAVLEIRHVVIYRLHHPEEVAKWMTNRTAHVLSLSPEEKSKVGAIIARHMADIENEVQPRVSTQLNLMRDEIAQVLDQNKAAKWRALFDKLRQRWGIPLPPQETSIQGQK